MKSLQYLNKYFLKYKWRFGLGILFTVVSNYFGAKMPVFIGDKVNEIINGDIANDVNTGFWIAFQISAIYIGLSVAKGFFLFLMRQTIIVMSRLIEFDMKNEIFAHYQKLDQAFFKRNATGDLMNRISEDVSQVRNYTGPGMMYSVNLIALFAMCITQMVLISPTLTLYVLIPLPIMSLMVYKVSSRMSALSTEVQREQSMLSTIAQETFAGIRVIKAYNRTKETAEKFEASSDQYKKNNMRLVLVNAFFMPSIMFLIGLSTLLDVYIGGVMTFDKQIKLGEIVTFIFFVNQLTWPFVSIGWVTSIVQRAAASQKRINEFLNYEPTIANSNDEEMDFQGEISFKNVSFTYPDTGVQALKNVSFSIKKGDTLAIVGHTGSGKSTVLTLLMRQYDITNGDIFIDGKAIKNINLDAFRNQSGMVPQDVFLFSDSIANNLKFGVKEDEITEEDLINITKEAHIYHNIEDFPEKFETVLGERGVNLSGGQKQRISIARALLRHPKLLLLDDCLSAVDTETEEIILTNINKESSNRTTIVVSHRVSTIRNANQILVMENGEIIETGTHTSLLEKNGLYAEMYNKQLAEEKKSTE